MKNVKDLTWQRVEYYIISSAFDSIGFSYWGKVNKRMQDTKTENL